MTICGTSKIYKEKLTQKQNNRERK